MHGHVVSMCRHCGNSDVMMVGETIEKAREYIADLPQFFASAPVSTEVEHLRAARVTILDKDIARVRIHEHDIIIVTTECHDSYEECHSGWRVMATRKIIERRMMEQLGKLFGIMMDEEEPTTPPESNNKVRDTSFNILNQIDLPDDFLGPTH